MKFQPLAERANKIVDPVAKVKARQAVFDLAFPKGFVPFAKKGATGSKPPPFPVRKKLAAEGKAIPNAESGGSFPITDIESLKKAIQAFGRAKDKAAAKRHIIKNARRLKAGNLIPKQWGITNLAVHVQRRHILDLATMNTDDKAAIDAINKSAKQTLSTLGPLLGKIADQRVLGAAVRQIEQASSSISQTRWWVDSPTAVDFTEEEQAFIDLAMTKDGRTSYKRQGKWGHGFVPLDALAKRSKAKGSPIAAKRVDRLFGSPAKATSASRAAVTATMKARAKTAASKGNVIRTNENQISQTKHKSKGSAERVQDVGQSLHVEVKNSRPSQRVKPAAVEVGKGRRSAARATRDWDSLPESQKTIRNGKKYVMSTFNGQNVLTEWVGGNPGQAAADPAKRQFRTARAVELANMTTAQLRRLLKTGKQSKQAAKAINAMLNSKTKAKANKA